MEREGLVNFMNHEQDETKDQKQETRRGAQCKAEALPEAWRVLLRANMSKHRTEDKDRERHA